jgi:hypothetical protein
MISEYRFTAAFPRRVFGKRDRRARGPNMVQNFIKSNLDMNIQRKVIAAEPKMHADVARHLQRIMKKPR